MSAFFDLLYDLFMIAYTTVQMLGFIGGVGFCVFAVYLGCTKRGRNFLRWLYDEFGL